MREGPARLCVLFCLLVMLGAAAPAHPYAGWAAIVVAGDDADSGGNPSQGFDNARRAIARDLLKLGFAPANVAQFSLHPRALRGERVYKTRPTTIARVLGRLASQAQGGCLLYFSSHGEADGLVVGNWVEPPLALAQMVDAACGARPTVVILSACFSGVMLPPLEGPARMILTAARRDRTSFGCGQTDRYPYFDDCILKSWNGAADFPDLARRAKACVAERERAEHLKPHSEPQFWIGPQALASLPKWH